MTDGLADTMWPAWDASGKYLWFLASTDYGLLSQWLDMTSYDHAENFGLYVAVLKKGEASPFLPESDEDAGIGSGRPSVGPGRGGPPSPAASAGQAGETPEQAGGEQPAAGRPSQKPVIVQIDFDSVQQRVLAVPGVPERQYSKLRAGVAGQVFYLEAGSGGGRGGDAAGGGGSTLQRYRLSDRKAATFVAGATDFALSADGRKLLYRAAAARLRLRLRRGKLGRACSSWTPIAIRRRRPPGA